MKTLKSSQTFIKLHQSDHTDSYFYIKAKEVELIEDNPGEDGKGSIVYTPNRGFCVKESPDEVMALLDKAVQNAKEYLASNILGLIDSIDSQLDGLRHPRKVID